MFARGTDTGHNPWMATRAYIALGTNRGDRQAHLAGALAALGSLPGVLSIEPAPIYETNPVGGPPRQGKFLNSVAAVNTELTPEALLEQLNQIEADRGRDRQAESQRCGPRTLDLDILLFGDQIIGYPQSPTPAPCDTRHPNPDTRSAALTIPHPRMHHRDFVLRPLCDIAPDAVHPVLHRTVRELLIELETPAR